MDNICLQVNSLCTGFFTGSGEARAVDDVSIEVPKGSIVGIVGESGCGKSMTARSIMRLVKYPGKTVGGSVKLEGKELLELSEAEMAKIRGKEISMIFQEPMTSLNPVMKVGRQVQEVLMLHEKLSKAEAKKRVLSIFEEVGIPEPERRYHCYPHEFSGGLRQRAMIAMAMICKPKLLIADEPTTALDVTVEAQILQLMKKLRDMHGTSIILISHNLGVVAELCDYVYVMYKGQVVEQADVFSLFDRATHPYTQGLLGAVRSLEEKQATLETIPGMVPSLKVQPKGCCFADRCSHCSEGCRTERPALQELEKGHIVRCFKARELYDGK